MAERFRIPEDCIEEEPSSSKSPSPEEDGSSLPILNGLKKRPTVVIVVGMAGSGKTTLMSQLHRSLRAPCDDDETDTSKAEETSDETQTSEDGPSSDTIEIDGRKVGYCVNLDPATKLLPFGASIDIRDTVNYKEVMKQHNLGPNGAIMTSLNLFATKFDQVMTILDKRAPALDYILIDTPGQIEAFTWSACGSIISEALATSFPTVMAYVVDTPRCVASPNTFMSNMLYACSIMYRTRLPVVVVFNKTDVVPAEPLMEWMKDYDLFQEVLDETSAANGYYGSLTRSLSLVLDEFYGGLHSCGMSAATGDGMESFWEMIEGAKEEFVEGYVEDLKLRVEEQKIKRTVKAKNSLDRLKNDLEDEDA